VEKISLNQVQEFLRIKKIAVVGFSRNPKDFSRTLSADLVKHGYEIIPINYNSTEIAGEKCYANISSAEKAIDGILVFTKKDAGKVIDEAITKGIKQIWLRNMFTPAKELEEIQKKCATNGINFISGYCPYMFLDDKKFPHNFHKFFTKLSGNFPKADGTLT